MNRPSIGAGCRIVPSGEGSVEIVTTHPGWLHTLARRNGPAARLGGRVQGGNTGGTLPRGAFTGTYSNATTPRRTRDRRPHAPLSGRLPRDTVLLYPQLGRTHGGLWLPDAVPVGLRRALPTDPRLSEALTEPFVRTDSGIPGRWATNSDTEGGNGG